MGLILGVIAVLVIIGMCSSDGSSNVQPVTQYHYHYKQCWRCGRMVMSDSDGDYICSCGRRWR